MFHPLYIIEPMTYEKYRAGLDTDVFARMTPDELRQAEQLLLDLMPSDDRRHIIGLGVMKSKAALPALHKMFESLRLRKSSWFGNTQPSNVPVFLQVLLALWRIERFPQADTYDVDVLERGKLHFSHGIDAVQILGEIGTPVCEAALFKTLYENPEYLLRYHAAVQLLMIHGWHWRQADDAIGRFAPQIGKFPVDQSVVNKIKAKFRI